MINNLTVIIVAYKSYEVIRKNINNLIHYNVIIVDNSNDNNLQSFLEKYPNIKYINSKKNIGFAKANNLAVNYAKTEYIFLVNPDTSFKEQDVKILLKTFSNYENVGLAVPSIYNYFDERVDNVSYDYIKRKNYFNFFSKKNKNLNIYNNSSGDICCENVSCSAFMFETNYFKSISGFDENFFMFFEDNDLCKKIILNNKTIIENPNAKIYHLGNSSGNYSFYDKSVMIFSHKVSEYIFLNKYINKKKLILVLLINLFDYTQRIFTNFIRLRFFNSFKNLIRCYSIIFFFIFKLFL